MKKILALLAGVVISFNASASYTQYNFGYDPGNNVHGYFVQNDDTKAIAFYSLSVTDKFGTTLFHPAGQGNIASAYNNFSSAGPTSFGVFYDQGGSYFESLVINFEADNPAYGFHAFFTQEREPTAPPSVPAPSSGSYFGIVTVSDLMPGFAAELDSTGGYFDGINRIIPTARVPEPATLGLFALGAFAAGAARRRKLAK